MNSPGLVTALNFLWAAISVFALAALGAVEWRQRRISSAYLRGRRLSSVLLLSLCLFPSVSTSDDLFSYSVLESHLGRNDQVGGSSSSGETNESGTVTLLRLLISLDHFQAETFWFFCIFLTAAASVVSVRRCSPGQRVLRVTGRAPPAF